MYRSVVCRGAQTAVDSVLVVITAAGRITWRSANAIVDTDYSRREGRRGISRLAESSGLLRRSLWG